VRVAAILLLPIIPKSAAEILRRVGETTPLDRLRLDAAAWRSEGERTLHKGASLWPRIESESTNRSDRSVGRTDRSKSVTEETKPAAPATPAAAPAAPVDNRISIDDFLKIDLRVARVLAAERVPNSRKLMKLSIDVGTEQRTLVAGIAEAYEPEQLVGKTVGIVFNLKPAKLMGIESNGMILAASPEGGKPVLVAFDGDIAPGSRIR
jgi:methionyl-tRNA synthetase